MMSCLPTMTKEMFKGIVFQLITSCSRGYGTDKPDALHNLILQLNAEPHYELDYKNFSGYFKALVTICLFVRGQEHVSFHETSSGKRLVQILNQHEKCKLLLYEYGLFSRVKPSISYADLVTYLGYSEDYLCNQRQMEIYFASLKPGLRTMRCQTFP